MGQTPHIFTRRELRRKIWGHWNPESSSSIWLENETYAEVQELIAYYHAHPQQADPEKLLKLLDRMVSAWKSEQDKVRTVMDEMISHYRQVIDDLEEDEQEITRLESVINRIQSALNDAVVRQNELQHRLDEIERAKARSENLAVTYRNELVAFYNSVVNDVYFQKYASEHILTVKTKIEDIDSRDLDPASVQAIALEGIGCLRSASRLVERKRSEYAMAYLVAEEQLNSLEQQIVQWRDKSYFDEDRQHKIDMDFWSRGYFSEMLERFKILKQRILDSDTRPGYMYEDLQVDLKNISALRKLGDEIMEEVLNISDISERHEALGKLTAYIMCDDFHYALSSYGYNNDDERDAFVVQMENQITGCKIQFVFTPLSPTQSLLTYNISFSRYEDEQYAWNMISKMLELLKVNGIKFNMPSNNVRDSFVDDIVFFPKGTTIRLPQRSATQSGTM